VGVVGEGKPGRSAVGDLVGGERKAGRCGAGVGVGVWWRLVIITIKLSQITISRHQQYGCSVALYRQALK